MNKRRLRKALREFRDIDKRGRTKCCDALTVKSKDGTLYCFTCCQDIPISEPSEPSEIR